MPCTKQDKLFKGCWNKEGTSKEERNPKKKTQQKAGNRIGRKVGSQVDRQTDRQEGRKQGKKETKKGLERKEKPEKEKREGGFKAGK